MRTLVLVALLMLVPGVAAQAGVGGPAPPPADTGYAGGPVTVPLYAHVFDLLQKAPMNTQTMIDLDLARGFGNPSVSGGASGEGVFPEAQEFYLVSTPGLVEYETTENGLPRLHPERGISYDVLFDTSKPLVGHWFMSAKALDLPQQGQTSGPEAGAMPGFTVRMTMRVGDDIGADLDAGEVIAQGEATLADPTTWIVNGEAVEFIVDMGTPLVDRIDGHEAFNVKVEWFNAEAPDGTMVTQRDWILHTGSRYPNRVDMTILNPIAIYGVNPTPVGNDLLVIRTEMNTPWGNYDIDVSKLEIDIQGPSQATNLEAPLVVQKSFEHNHHYEPVLVTWVWPFKDGGAQPGEYTVTVRATNLQGTSSAEKSASFVIPEDGRVVGYSDTGEIVTAEDQAPPAETPGFALALAVLALAGVAAARRR